MRGGCVLGERRGLRVQERRENRAVVPDHADPGRDALAPGREVERVDGATEGGPEDEVGLLEASVFMDSNECATIIPASRGATGCSTDEVIRRLADAGAQPGRGRPLGGRRAEAQEKEARAPQEDQAPYTSGRFRLGAAIASSLWLT